MRWLVPLGIILCQFSSSTAAATAVFSLAIGYNGVPPNTRESGVTELHFADDDALAVHRVALTVARRSVVLALPDRSTLARNPSGYGARPPSVIELRRALSELGAEIEKAASAGEESSVWFFYSGHGWLDEEQRASLTLADGALTQDMLYDEVLRALRAQTIHVMIDACHAEALIRPRDVNAETVEIPAFEVASSSLRKRLASMPHVGAILASTSSTQAHEWDEYQTGIFTHELLSGLRGGADVNGDGRVEYSEMAAFLASANRKVTDPRARLTTLVAAPKLYPRVAIVDNRTARGVARLRGRAHHLGRFQIDDQRGNRLIDLRTEPAYAVQLMVPEGEPLLLVNERGESTFQGRADQPIDLEGVLVAEAKSRPRGAVAESIRRGLFATEFGPAYYAGFIDNADEKLIPVEVSPLGVQASLGASTQKSHDPMAWAAMSGAGLAFATAGVCAVLAASAYADFNAAEVERSSVAAHDRYARYGTAAMVAGAVGVSASAVAWWLFRREDTGRNGRPGAWTW